jgi:hypothetical protein
MGWTQAVCASCWMERNPDREPVRMLESPVETCCFCGNLAASGIYMRIDPKTVPYPSKED